MCYPKQQLPQSSIAPCTQHPLCSSQPPLTLSSCLFDPLPDHPRDLWPHNACEALQPLLQRNHSGVRGPPRGPGGPQGTNLDGQRGLQLGEQQELLPGLCILHGC